MSGERIVRGKGLLLAKSRFELTRERAEPRRSPLLYSNHSLDPLHNPLYTHRTVTSSPSSDYYQPYSSTPCSLAGSSSSSPLPHLVVAPFTTRLGTPWQPLLLLLPLPPHQQQMLPLLPVPLLNLPPSRLSSVSRRKRPSPPKRPSRRLRASSHLLQQGRERRRRRLSLLSSRNRRSSRCPKVT